MNSSDAKGLASLPQRKQKGRDPFGPLPLAKLLQRESLFLLLSGLLGHLLGGFLLSCHGESPPHQIALSARNRENKIYSLAKD